MTSIYDYIENNDIEGVKKILKTGIDINKIDDSGSTPLHIAVNLGELDIIELLIIEGADVNKLDAYGKPPILCIDWDNEKIIKMLLEYGANPNIEDSQGRTILDMAYDESMTNLVQLLLKYGAKSAIKPSDYGLSDDNYI